MAKPMTQDQMVTAFKAAGLTVREFSGWRSRCRCCSGAHSNSGPYIRGWGNVNGGVQHITAGGLGKRSVESYIRDIIVSDPVTPSKCQWVVDPAGVLWLVAAGRCNHAGKVSSRFRNAMIDETLPFSGYVDLRGGDVDGNSFTYGIESIAAKKMNAKQRATCVKVWAAVCKHHGWSAGSIGGHGEGSNQRSYSDPNEDMGKFRKDVEAAITAKPKPKVPTKNPQESTDEEAEMAAVQVENPVTGKKWGLAKTLWSIWTYAYRGERRAAALEKQVSELQKQIGDLTAEIRKKVNQS